MDAQLQTFQTRVRNISRKHERLSRGHETMITRSGLIVARPSRRRITVPWRGMTMALMAVIFLKGGLYAGVGAEEYDSRVAHLALGGTLAQTAAWALRADPVTLGIADMLTVKRADPDGK